MTLSKKEIRIAIMGGTGSGKSTFINLASSSTLPVSRGLHSCTSDVDTSKPFLLDGRIVTLIDTPGFDDTKRSDTDILQCIVGYLAKTYEQGTKLAGIIYMHRISDVRMGGTSTRNFRIFRELCGESTLRNVLVVTNFWGKVEPDIGEERENELANNDTFFKPVLKKGARLLRHDGTQASAYAILRQLIDNEETALQIQKEIVDQQKDLAQTAAGSELASDLTKQAKHHEEELQKLRKELENALRRKDEETRLEIQEKIKKVREENDRIKRDSECMVSDFAAEKARLDTKITEMEAENRRLVRELQGLQDEVVQVRKEVERAQLAHAQRETEMLKSQIEEMARLLERERKARKQAETRHQERLRFLRQDVQSAEGEKKWATAERVDLENTTFEREHWQDVALAAGRRHPAETREKEEMTRREEEARDRARLQDDSEIARALTEEEMMEKARRELAELRHGDSIHSLRGRNKKLRKYAQRADSLEDARAKRRGRLRVLALPVETQLVRQTADSEEARDEVGEECGRAPWGSAREQMGIVEQGPPSQCARDAELERQPNQAHVLAEQRQAKSTRTLSDATQEPGASQLEKERLLARSAPRYQTRISLRNGDRFPFHEAGDPPCYGSSAREHPIFFGSAIFERTKQPCKIDPYLRSRCYVPWGDSEIVHEGSYDLLPFNSKTMEWVATSHGHIPPHRTPVDGGHEEDGAKLYHALASVRGLRIPGKTGEHLRGCNFSYYGKGYSITTKYDILCWK